VDRAANLLGAVALRLTDGMAGEVAAAAGAGGRPGAETAGVALSALSTFLEEPTIDRLRQVLGLTSSGAVRLVDRLADGGLVRRGTGADGRTTTVALTPAGRRAARRVVAARARVLDDAVAVLSPADRATFEALLGRVAAGLIREPGATRWMCRLCDTGTCGVADRSCPVTRAALARHGGSGSAPPPAAAPRG
jgi:DNA-binding MarR family transcriptional regulator